MKQSATIAIVRRRDCLNLVSGVILAGFLITAEATCPAITALGSSPGLTASAYAQTAPLGNDAVGSDSACSESTLSSAAAAASSLLSQSFAEASYGVLRVSVNGSTDPANPRSMAKAEAGWTDSFLITGGSGNGSFDMVVQADGLFGGPGTATLNYGLQQLAVGSGTSVSTYVWNGHEYAVLSPQTSELVVSVTFTYGTEFLLHGWASLCGETDAIGACSSNFVPAGAFAADFSHTANFFLRGLSQDAILTTASGATYSESAAPVPEPETYAMLLAGLGLLGFAARRRKLKEAA